MHGRGACMVGGCAWQILRDMVNEWAVRILLECILVFPVENRSFPTYKVKLSLKCWLFT